jgi:peroxiredoxin
VSIRLDQTPSASSWSRTLVAGAATLLVAVVATLNVFLVAANSRLRAQLARASMQTVAGRLTDLTGVGLDGRISQVRFDSGRKYLVFAFSANCRFCQASLDYWKALSHQADPAKWSVVWVSRDSLDSARAFARDESVKDLVLADVPYRLYAQLGLASVPQTVAISEGGIVIGSVRGALDSDNVSVLSRLLVTSTGLRR